MPQSFDLNAFYTQALDPESHPDPTAILDYINSFVHVIVYGAANFGSEIGAYLLKNGVGITAYWDERYKEITELHGSTVRKPFSGKFIPEETLVILAINNNVLKAPLYQRTVDSGYTCLKGEYLYMGVLCPFTKETGVSAKKCIDPLSCRFICCERLGAIVAERTEPKPGPRIDLTYVCVLVNSLCTLDCKYCVQYINNYPKDRQVNIPTERVCADIKTWLAAVDSIGGVSVMGGETFAHPEIHLIADALSACENFGLASFPTSGTVPLIPWKLEHFRDPRLSINFGNYKRVLTPKQLDTFETNVEIVKSMGLSYTLGNPMEKWIKPSTLYNLQKSVGAMMHDKARCPMPPRNLQVSNGKIYPCDLGVAIHGMGLANYDGDRLDVDAPDLRSRLRDYIEFPFYWTCGHCDGYHETCEAMVQGHHDFAQKDDQ